MESMPVQVIWGEDDLIIPVSHAHIAHDAIPGSRLEIFEESGHMPHRDHPDRFVAVVEQFIASTAPAEFDEDVMGAMMRSDVREYADSVDSAQERSTQSA
jgi:hypothetical protein